MPKQFFEFKPLASNRQTQQGLHWDLLELHQAITRTSLGPNQEFVGTRSIPSWATAKTWSRPTGTWLGLMGPSPRLYREPGKPSLKLRRDLVRTCQDLVKTALGPGWDLWDLTRLPQGPVRKLS